MFLGTKLLIGELLEGSQRRVIEALRSAIHIEESGVAVQNQSANVPAFHHRVKVVGVALEAQRQLRVGRLVRSFRCCGDRAWKGAYSGPRPHPVEPNNRLAPQPPDDQRRRPSNSERRRPLPIDRASVDIDNFLEGMSMRQEVSLRRGADFISALYRDCGGDSKNVEDRP